MAAVTNYHTCVFTHVKTQIYDLTVLEVSNLKSVSQGLKSRYWQDCILLEATEEKRLSHGSFSSNCITLTSASIVTYIFFRHSDTPASFTEALVIILSLPEKSRILLPSQDP